MQQTTAGRMLAQYTRYFAIVSMATKMLHHCARVWHKTGVLSTNAYIGVYVTQVFLTSAYTFASTFAAGCARALVYAQFLHSRHSGDRGWEVLESLCKALVAWCEGSFSTEGETGVLSVSSLFFDGCVGVGVYVCVCVCICPHTHTHCTWGTWM